VLDNQKFIDDEDRLTSFLFNMLSNSFNIRAQSFALITYSEKGDWINYTKALATIIYDLIYFTSDAGAKFETDLQSPYLEYLNGTLSLKNEIESDLI
jgi:hypothetical protein